MKKNSTQVLVEGSAMVALATILSYIRVFKFPTGGSVTLLSMLPIVVFSMKHGVKKGIFVSFVFALVQLLQGVSEGLFGWGLTAPMLISCILLDYIVAFTAIGFAGIFRNKGAVGRISGTIIALVIRFICHFLSGVVIWGTVGELWTGFSIDNVFLYSLVYNGIYMLPEIIFTVIGAHALFTVPQTSKLLAG
ncbi:MAG: energy-coupled thiamine transporter ThiT [Oscillospiraceae bacterium]|nr:energy-coupled thiamine transporter ThiT [Oscillospiraceae bacterium]